MARIAGIEAFCYYEYWFGNGRQLMELPFEEVVSTGKPDFPFCLCWANHSWYKKLWDPQKKGKDKLLIEQKYPGKDDYINHFNHLLPAFRDNRYVRVNALIYAYHFLNNSNVNLNPISWKLIFRNDTKAPKDRYLDLNP